MDLSSLIENLNADDIQKLQETAAAFFSGAKPEQKTQNTQNTGLSLPGLTPELLGQAAKISAAFSQSDPRSDFMLALKPLLTPARQKKADEAAVMIRLFGVFTAMREEKR